MFDKSHALKDVLNMSILTKLAAVVAQGLRLHLCEGPIISACSFNNQIGYTFLCIMCRIELSVGVPFLSKRIGNMFKVYVTDWRWFENVD